MDTAASANRLLRNQLRDVAGQLLTLTERLCLLTRELEGVDHFQRSARDDAFREMPPAGFPTFNEAVNLAMRAERELAEARARQGYPEFQPGQRNLYPGPPEDPFQKGRTTKRPKTEPKLGQARKKGPEPVWKPCVICYGAHRMMSCPWKRDHCFQCGKPGHSRFTCPQKPATTTTPAPRPDEPEKAAAPAPQGGLSPRTRADQRSRKAQEEGREGATAPAPQEDLHGGQLTPDSLDAGPLPRHAVRRWPKGCGRTPKAAPVEDATSRNDK